MAYFGGGFLHINDLENYLVKKLCWSPKFYHIKKIMNNVLI